MLIRYCVRLESLNPKDQCTESFRETTYEIPLQRVHELEINKSRAKQGFRRSLYVHFHPCNIHNLRIQHQLWHRRSKRQ